MAEWNVFLGGHDLEMIEIERLLASRDDVVVHDRQLGWGAAVASSYLPELQAALGRNERIVLVELADDLPAEFPRDRIDVVDHHGNLAGEGRPTAIEQIFSLLRFPQESWTDDLKLVAANDRGHIDALRRAGATIEQIRDIRTRDRQAQGITAEEERLGLEAASRAEYRLRGRLTVVHLPHAQTSTVTDALDPHLGGCGFQNLLIFCPHQTNFFGDGRGIQTLQMHYPDCWSGGELPRRGYWGTAESLPESTVVDILKGPLMSKPATDIVVKCFHHTLIWPLLMRDSNEDTKQGFDRNVDDLKAAGWAETAENATGQADPEYADKPAPIDKDYTYEEIVYFHPFVRDLLFGDGKSKVRERALRRFKRTDFKGVRITIDPGPDSQTMPFGVTLRVERTEVLLIRPRVLILLVEVSNRQLVGDSQAGPQLGDPRGELTLAQVLYLQSRMRHIYPPYFDRDGHQGDVLASLEWIGPPTPSPAPTKPQYTLASLTSEFDTFVRKGAEPPMYAHWRALFGDRVKPLETVADREGEGCFLQQMIDDRIPSMSFIAVDDPADIDIDDEDRLPAFDPPGLDFQRPFRDLSREDFLYTRFRHWGTTYYCNGTSFAAVCNTGGFSNVLLTHFRRHYTHLAVIAQFQHSALLFFADALADTAKDLAGRKTEEEFSDPRWRNRIRALQHRFLKFRTRAYFTEVSNQIQGKDLFRLWFERLGTADLFDRVSNTNTEVYQALEDQEAKELAVAQTRLARVATIGLAFSILLSTLSAVFAWVPLDNQVLTPLRTWDWLGIGISLAILQIAFLLWSSFHTSRTK